MALEEGNVLAKRVFDAMVYQLSKDIAALSSVMCMEVDAIILTGGMAYSQEFCDAVEARVGKIAPVLRYPGEMEMLSLAQGALRVLHGEEEPGIF
jgi:butyrate kinase